MSRSFQLSPAGVREMQAAMNAQIQKIKGATLAGLIEASTLIIGNAQERAPIHYGNLRASATIACEGIPPQHGPWDTDTRKVKEEQDKSAGQLKQLLDAGFESFEAECKEITKSEKPSVAMGFGAYYAIFVHEDMNAKHPIAGEAKFLERAMVDNEQAAIALIARSVSRAL